VKACQPPSLCIWQFFARPIFGQTSMTTEQFRAGPRALTNSARRPHQSHEPAALHVGRSGSPARWSLPRQHRVHNQRRKLVSNVTHTRTTDPPATNPEIPALVLRGRCLIVLRILETQRSPGCTPCDCLGHCYRFHNIRCGNIQSGVSRNKFAGFHRAYFSGWILCSDSWSRCSTVKPHLVAFGLVLAKPDSSLAPKT
jgi:hypothetical protein